MYVIPLELQFVPICYFHIVEVSEMYECLEEMVHKNAISNHNLNIIIKAKFMKSMTRTDRVGGVVVGYQDVGHGEEGGIHDARGGR